MAQEFADISILTVWPIGKGGYAGRDRLPRKWKLENDEAGMAGTAQTGTPIHSIAIDSKGNAYRGESFG
jgi:hypothetical protein